MEYFLLCYYWNEDIIINVKIFIKICIIMTLLCTCSNKREISANVNEAAKNNTAIATEKESNILYVNAKEGLRVRDEPNLTGNIIYLLSHKEPVIIIEKSMNEVEIDGIIDFWYLVQNKETNGWVFGGYLYESLEKLEEDEFEDTISGRYNYYSIDMKKDENIYKGKFFRVNEDKNVYKERFFGEIDELFCEIEHINYNNFLLKYRSPRRYADDEIRGQQKEPFKFPPENTVYWYPSFISRYNGIPFCIIGGEKGGGGTYLYFYYDEGQIIMDYKYYSNLNAYLEEGESEMPIEWLEYTIVFNKE